MDAARGGILEFKKDIFAEHHAGFLSDGLNHCFWEHEISEEYKTLSNPAIDI